MRAPGLMVNLIVLLADRAYAASRSFVSHGRRCSAQCSWSSVESASKPSSSPRMPPQLHCQSPVKVASLKGVRNHCFRHVRFVRGLYVLWDTSVSIGPLGPEPALEQAEQEALGVGEACVVVPAEDGGHLHVEIGVVLGRGPDREDQMMRVDRGEPACLRSSRAAPLPSARPGRGAGLPAHRRSPARPAASRWQTAGSPAAAGGPLPACAGYRPGSRPAARLAGRAAARARARCRAAARAAPDARLPSRRNNRAGWASRGRPSSAIWSRVAPRNPFAEKTSSAASRMRAVFRRWFWVASRDALAARGGAPNPSVLVAERGSLSTSPSPRSNHKRRLRCFSL